MIISDIVLVLNRLAALCEFFSFSRRGALVAVTEMMENVFFGS
jgi:hypothetical protein